MIWRGNHHIKKFLIPIDSVTPNEREYRDNERFDKDLEINGQQSEITVEKGRILNGNNRHRKLKSMGFTHIAARIIICLTALLSPSLLMADRLGSLNSNAQILLSTQVVTAISTFTVYAPDSVSSVTIGVTDLPSGGGFGPQVAYPYIYGQSNVNGTDVSSFRIMASTHPGGFSTGRFGDIEYALTPGTDPAFSFVVNADATNPTKSISLSRPFFNVSSTMTVTPDGSNEMFKVAESSFSFFGVAVSSQSTPIANAAGGIAIDVEARNAINALLQSMRRWGFVQP